VVQTRGSEHRSKAKKELRPRILHVTVYSLTIE